MEKAYISPHVEKILKSKDGMKLLIQIVENQKKISNGETVTIELSDGEKIEVRRTNDLVDPKDEN